MAKNLSSFKGRYPFLIQWFPALAAILVLAAYIPVLSFELSTANFGLDGGELVTAALIQGVAHPSGYPTYLVLLRTFLNLPWPSPYWGASLFSTCAAAAVVAWIYQCSMGEESGLAESTFSLIGGMAVAGSMLFASQAVIAEVYVLNTLFVLLALTWAVKISQSNRSRRESVWLFLLAFSGGIGLGNHLTVLFALLLVLFELGKRLRQKNAICQVLIQLAGFSCGLLIYLYLPFAARLYPAVNWGNPQTLAGFWWELSGVPYQGLLGSLPLEMFAGRLFIILRMLVDQFSPFGMVLAGIGFYFLPRAFKIKTAWIFLIYCLFSASYHTPDSVVYLLPAWAMVGIWMGKGALISIQYGWRGLNWGKMLVGITAVWVVVNSAGVWPKIDPRRDVETSRYLAAIADLPPGAILLTESDAESFPAWYIHFGLRQRPDLYVIVLPLTRYRWYQETLGQVYPDLVQPISGERTYEEKIWGEDLVDLNPAKIVCRTRTEGETPQMLFIHCGNTKVYSGEVFSEDNW
jgi:hypothetical protein